MMTKDKKHLTEKDFDKLDIYRARGNNFIVEITHRVDCIGEHIWCLYTYIYPKHFLNNKVRNNTVDYDLHLANSIFPELNGGCTYYHKNEDYVKVGYDYNHIWNGGETRSKEMPDSVLNNAETLFRFCEEEIKK